MNCASVLMHSTEFRQSSNAVLQTVEGILISEFLIQNLQIIAIPLVFHCNFGFSLSS